MTRLETRSAVKKRHLVIFLINETQYAVDIGRIREIVYFKEPMPLPESPAFIEGLLDLRGTVIPVIHLKKKMGVVTTSPLPPTHILIVSIGKKTVGIIVDEVRHVFNVEEDRIQLPQKIHEGPGSRYLAGVCRADDRMVFLLDLDALLTVEDQARLGEIRV